MLTTAKISSATPLLALLLLVVYCTPQIVAFVASPNPPFGLGLRFLPNFDPGCTIQVVTNADLAVADDVELQAKLVNWSRHSNLVIIILAATNPFTLPVEEPRPLLRFGQCTVFVVISPDESLNLFLDVISSSSQAAHRHHTPFFGLISTPIDDAHGQDQDRRLQDHFRSRIFYERHPIVILIVQEPGPHWAMVCYLCHSNAVITWHKFGSLPGTLPEIRRLYSSLNSDGHGRVGEALGRYDLWALYGPEAATAGRRPLESRAFQSWREAPVIDVLADMLVRQFNLTFADFDGSEPRAIACLICDTPPYKHTELIILLFDEYVHLYCTRNATLQQASLVFFLRPFDMWIWAGLATFGLGLAIAILAFGGSKSRQTSLWHALDVVWFLIGARFQNPSWPRPIAVLIFACLFMSHNYVAYFTSDVLAPLKPDRIQTNKELFRRGFRIVSDRLAYELDKVQNGVEFNEGSFFQATSPEVCVDPYWINWGLCLAAWPDLGTRRIMTKFEQRSIRQIQGHEEYRDSGIFCTTVPEKWGTPVWLTVQFRGHLQMPLTDFVTRVFEAGIIPAFWDGLYVAGTSREFPDGLDPRFVFHRLSFNTALLSVIKLYGILVLTAAVTLLLELIHNTCRRRCILAWRAITAARVGYFSQMCANIWT